MQRELAGHRPLHEKAGDDEAVDLVGAFEDAVDARVAVGSLRRILFHVTVTGINLHHVVDDRIEHLRSPNLKDGALHRIFLDSLLDLPGRAGLRRIDGRECRVDHADRPVSHALSDEDGGRRVGDLLLDQAELGDGFAEGLPIFCVTNAVA